VSYADLLTRLRAASIVTVDVLGVSLRMRLMTGAEWSAFAAAVRAAKDGGDTERLTDHALLAQHLVDETGAPLVTDPQAFEEWPRAVVLKAAAELIRLSNLTGETAEKN
jgi:hypothetical protein